MPERPSLAAAVRFSATGMIESLHAFLAWNLALVLAAAIAVFLLSLTNLALLIVPFLAPLVCGLLRCATVARRDEVVTLRAALPGIRHRWRTKVVLATVQSVVLLLAVLNLFAAPAMGGLIAAMSMATSVYLAASLVAYAAVAWTLLCDPRRESDPVGRLARLALVVVLRRPLQVLVLLVVVVLSTVLVYNFVVPSLFLPSLVLLLIAGYVIPAADELVPVDEGQPS